MMRAHATKTEAGKNSLFVGYLIMVQVMVAPTTDASHGHSLANCIHVVRSYCAACKAAVVCATTMQGYFGCNIYIGERVDLLLSPPRLNFVLGYPGVEFTPAKRGG